MDDFLSAYRSIFKHWKGFRFFIASIDRPEIGGMGITTFTPPTITANMRIVPQLSNKVERVPTRVVAESPLILKAPVGRGIPIPTLDFSGGFRKLSAGTSTSVRLNGTLYAFMQDIINAVDGEAAYDKFDLAIAKFESDIATDTIPIAVYVASGCQASKFIPAPGNTNGVSEFPLDTLELWVDDYKRVL